MVAPLEGDVEDREVGVGGRAVKLACGQREREYGICDASLRGFVKCLAVTQNPACGWVV